MFRAFVKLNADNSKAMILAGVFGTDLMASVKLAPDYEPLELLFKVRPADNPDSHRGGHVVFLYSVPKARCSARSGQLPKIEFRSSLSVDSLFTYLHCAHATRADKVRGYVVHVLSSGRSDILSSQPSTVTVRPA